MKTNFFSFPILVLFFSFSFLVSFSFRNSENLNEVKYFTLTKGDSPMSGEVKAKLIAAYKAQYGSKSVINSVTLERINGETWLVFTSGSNKNPSVAYKTKKKDKPAETTVPSDAPKESCTGNPCSVCKFGLSGGCYCNGGEGECNHSISRITDDVNFMASLFN